MFEAEYVSTDFAATRAQARAIMDGYDRAKQRELSRTQFRYLLCQLWRTITLSGRQFTGLDVWILTGSWPGQYRPIGRSGGKSYYREALARVQAGMG